MLYDFHEVRGYLYNNEQRKLVLNGIVFEKDFDNNRIFIFNKYTQDIYYTDMKFNIYFNPTNNPYYSIEKYSSYNVTQAPPTILHSAL
jgi:hypothetical protein